MLSETQNLTPEKCKDAGLALVLICLLCYLAWNRPIFILLAIAFQVAAMTWPPIFKPFAWIWFRLSTALGTVVSRVILAILFYGIVFPVGLLRRLLGKDAMRLRDWKKGSASIFVVRNHEYSAQDLEHPY